MWRWLAIVLLVAIAPALAVAQPLQNFIVPTAPDGTSNNQAASTAFVQRNGGASGAFATVAALAAANIPGSLTSVTVQTMAVSGTSTCSLNFAKGTSTPTGIFGEVLNVASGVYWEPQYSTNPMRACEFGTVADGTISNVTNVIAGTDNTAIIQAALNYAIQNEWNAVCLNDGAYKITDTLHLGWGDKFYAVSLTSCNNNRNGGVGDLAGVQIYATATDRCAINIQGARNANVKGISLYGLNYTWAFFGMATSPWPTTDTGWLNTAIIPGGTNPGGLQRYAPYAGICEDAYAGAPPSTLGSFANYPFVTNYPSFTGLSTTAASVTAASPAVMTWPGSAFVAGNPVVCTAGTLPGGLSLSTLYYVKSPSGSTFNLAATPGGANINTTGSAGAGLTCSRQYGMNVTSNTTIQDAAVVGFAVNINLDSSTIDANNDFLLVDRVIVQNCVYCISIGNGQSRNVHLKDVQYAFCHTILTNNTFGVAIGKLGGPIDNMSGGECYQAFKIGALSFGFPTTINDFYAEGLTRLGSFAGGSNSNSVTFNGCNVSFGTGLGAVGASVTLPVGYLESTAGKTTFVMNSCDFSNGPGRIDALLHGPGSPEITGGSFSNGQIALPAINGAAGYPGVPVAYNYTGGLWMGGLQSSYPQNGGYPVIWNSPTSSLTMSSQTAFGNQLLQKQADFGSFANRAPFTQATRGFFDQFNQRWYEFAQAPTGSNINLGNGSVSNTLVLTCDVLTFNYLSANQAVGNPAGTINPGDILYYSGDGTFFVVVTVGALNVTAYPVTAIQMNNMVVNGTTGACVSSSISDPTMAAANTAIVHTAGTNFADVTAGATPGNIMIPANLYFGNFVAGSTAVSFVSFSSTQPRGDILATYQKVGDLSWGPPSFSDPLMGYPYPPGGKWSSLTAGTSSTFGSATLNVAATVTGRFPLSPMPIIGIGWPGANTFRYSAAGTALPACAAATNGVQLYVSDATAPTYHGAYTSGGAILAGVLCISGTGWVTD